MRYLLLIYQDEVAHSQWSQEQLAAEYQAYNEFTESVAKSGTLQSGEPLMPTNTATMRWNVRDNFPPLFAILRRRKRAVNDHVQKNAQSTLHGV